MQMQNRKTIVKDETPLDVLPKLDLKLHEGHELRPYLTLIKGHSCIA